MAISMLKIRRPLGRLIFNMGIAIPGKTVFLIETAPWLQQIAQRQLQNEMRKCYVLWFVARHTTEVWRYTKFIDTFLLLFELATHIHGWKMSSSSSRYADKCSKINNDKKVKMEQMKFT